MLRSVNAHRNALLKCSSVGGLTANIDSLMNTLYESKLKQTNVVRIMQIEVLKFNSSLVAAWWVPGILQYFHMQCFSLIDVREGRQKTGQLF